MESLSGLEFVRFARRLIYYEGAVVGQIKRDQAEREEGGQSPSSADVVSTKTIKMSDAMGQVSGDEFSSLNSESLASGMGNLFERVTVPGN